MRPLVLFALTAATLVAQSSIPGNQPFPPHKVVANIYYVGADDITSYLITTPAGHIVLNAGYAETVPSLKPVFESWDSSPRM